MDRPLQKHIARLEQKIALLKKQIGEPGMSDSEKASLRIDLGIAERSHERNLRG